MLAFILKRLLQAIFVLWAAYTVTFVTLYLIPGDPVEMMLNGGPGGTGAIVDQSQIDALRVEYGFDKPPLEQYVVRLGKALTGDFGRSVQTGETVTNAIARAFPETIKLTATATGIALVLGTLLAVSASLSRGRLRDLLINLPSLGVSLPVFWVGFLLIEWFAFKWRLFPPVGNKGWQSLVLPGVTLAIPASALLSQLLVRNLDWAMSQPYIMAVRAKGASEFRVQMAHALRNACLPVVTMLGMIVGNMLAGSVVTETVFSRSGIGQLLVRSVRTKDIPMVAGLVLLAALVFVVVNLAIDLLYPLIDRRVQIRRAEA